MKLDKFNNDTLDERTDAAAALGAGPSSGYTVAERHLQGCARGCSAPGVCVCVQAHGKVCVCVCVCVRARECRHGNARAMSKYQLVNGCTVLH